MKFGVQHGIGDSRWTPAIITPTEVKRFAQTAERVGYDAIAFTDHPAPSNRWVDSGGEGVADLFTSLAFCAAVTERVRLMSHVYVPAYRHPLAVAKAFATLDVVSGGRVIMGVGAGHVAGEFEVLGVPFAERGRLLDESIDALRAAFAEDYPTLPGPRWPAADVGQHPRSIQEDGPPIWVGGSSPAAIRRAATRGDGWLPQGLVTPEIIASIHEQRLAAGRHDAFDIGAFVGPAYVGEPDWDLGGPALTGSPEKLAHVLRKFSALGVAQALQRTGLRRLQWIRCPGR